MKTPTKSLTAPWKRAWWQQLWIKLAFLRVPNQNIDYLNSKSLNQLFQQDTRALSDVSCKDGIVSYYLTHHRL